MVRITCLVDDLAQDRHSWAEHGLALLVERERGRVLLDSGSSGTVLLHNLWRALRIDLQPLDALALSHGHSDHTGGLATVLAAAPGVRLVGHPHVFDERFARREAGIEECGCPLSTAEAGARSSLSLSAEPQELAPGIWTTGEIVVRPHEVSGSTDHMVKRGDQLLQDAYVDDMSLVAEGEQGLVVILGCCHAGLLNTLLQVRKVSSRPVQAIVGGTHLLGASDERLDAITATLREEYGSPLLHLNHCTSPEVVFRLQQRLGKERVQYLRSGGRVEL
jgi:7,8-dihydropterin-6-yl-methyl-4-(beta-D-ribofuranosyl)aminobenzene 5'-phosphate synthase